MTDIYVVTKAAGSDDLDSSAFSTHAKAQAFMKDVIDTYLCVFDDMPGHEALRGALHAEVDDITDGNVGMVTLSGCVLHLDIMTVDRFAIEDEAEE